MGFVQRPLSKVSYDSSASLVLAGASVSSPGRVYYQTTVSDEKVWPRKSLISASLVGIA